MANLLELAEKMGIKSDSLQEKKVFNNVAKRRPWLEDEGEQPSQSMAGINLSQLNIPKSEEPVKRKHVVRLDELSDAYSNPDKKKENLNNKKPAKMRELRYVRGVENEPVKKGELKKPDTLKAIGEKLERIQTKTDTLIEKSNNLTVKNHSQTIAKSSQSVANRSLKRPTVSYLDFILNKGIRKEILKYIEQNIFEENNEHYSFIDTDEISKKVSTTSGILRDTIYKLKKEGWFIIKNQHYNRRLIQININNFRK